jgi:hypothetical protein
VEPGNEGMSVTPGDPMLLPHHRKPASLGGIGRHPVWELDTSDLPEYLVYAEDTREHGFIQPAFTMEIADYQAAIEETRDLWEKIVG